jgi:GNAT superfamily N-acetyltransferase
MQFDIADNRTEMLAGVTAGDLVVERVQTAGSALECGYDLFERVFDPAVLDPRSVYVDRMAPEALACRDFLPCYTVAYVDRGNWRLIVSFLSADVMWLGAPADGAILAIGNIATSPFLKELGIRGAGTRLVAAAIEHAQREAAKDGRPLLCVATEAEPASLGFWAKCGFLWPKGCSYLQPPLEWDDLGRPLYAEVPETLLLAPLDMPRHEVEPAIVRSIIRAIYENWCLRVWRDQKAHSVLESAEQYVMGRVLGKVMSTMPTTPMPLIAACEPR